jgi:SAM-dependent methyltransferase
MNKNASAGSSVSDDQAISRTQLEFLSIAEGFFESRILFSINKLGIFSLLGEEAKSLQEIAASIDARPDTLARLLNAGVALKLLQSAGDGNYQINPVWWPVLVDSESESYLGNWLNLLDYLSSSLTDLDKAAVKGGPTLNYLAAKDKKDIREFTLAMHNYAALRGKELVKFLDTSDCKTLLDLGTGPGTYAFHLGIANPDLELFLIDLPEVLEVAHDVEKRYPLKNKITYLPMDVTQEEIPGTYDMVMVSNTLHMLGEEESRKLLKRLFNVVKPGGSLVIQFQYMKDNKLGGRWPTILDMVQLCITDDGRNHSVGETRSWMEEAGYTDIKFSPMNLLNTNGYLRGYRK